jgi:oxaloacetate decarboxylase alpha subunit
VGKRSACAHGFERKDKILNRGRAKEWQSWEPPEPSLAEVRRKFGGPSLSDEDLLLRVYAGEDAVKAMNTAGAPRDRLNGKQPLIRLIEELSRKKDCNQIFIRRPDLSLTLSKRN